MFNPCGRAVILPLLLDVLHILQTAVYQDSAADLDKPAQVDLRGRRDVGRERGTAMFCTTYHVGRTDSVRHCVCNAGRPSRGPKLFGRK